MLSKMKMVSTVVSMKLVGAIFVVLQLEFLMSNYCGAVTNKNVGSVSGGCIEKERHALLEFKVGLVADDTYLLSSWDTKSDDCCEWEGITCSNQTGHVEMLDLNGDQFGPFRGEIKTSLIELQHLKYLNLSFNIFSKSNIPELFGSLRNLRFLDLQDSHFGGRIPNDLSRLSHLKYLDLSANGLNGRIPPQLGNLSHLQYLNLSQNFLFGTIPHQLGSLSNLQELHLGYNYRLKFHGKNNRIGGEWLSNLTLLTHLDLSDLPNLSSSHVWMQMIGKLPKIEELRLSRCDLLDLYLLPLSRSPLNFSTSLAIFDLSANTFASSKIFEWVFTSTSNLTELDLSKNNLEGSIPYDSVNIGKPLERLDLSYNFLNGSTLESFRDICTLHSLQLDFNNLNEDISMILLKLSGCARYSVKYLSLRFNRISGTFPDLTIFPSLIEIDLSDNLLSGKVSDGIPKSLQSLRIEYNSLEGGIPKLIGNLCSLRSLDLSNNKLNEDLSVILQNLSVGCAKYSLKKLYLASNQIIGTVPDMSGFSSLENLDLSDNLLSGRILKNSLFPYQLVSLDLDFNNLSGVFTDSHFSNMSMLKYLSLNSNSLTLKFSENWVPPFQLSTVYLRSCVVGPSFPKWLQSQKHLHELEMSDARISDVVPVWFWNQTRNLIFMNISHNNLSGTIPNLPIRFFEGCDVILESNQFEGSVPLFFQSATLLLLSDNKFSETHSFLCTNTTVDRLQILDLSKNQLKSQLPDCWSHLKVLEFLDLSDNTLSGEVPSSMGSLIELMVLVLRNNSLRGKLPVSLKNCAELIMLDVGDNRLSGPIPHWLGPKLQILSLRRNQFHGRLPQSLCFLTDIQLLDLSENNLLGHIFKCLKNFSAMSQDVPPTRTINSNLYVPIGSGVSILTQGYDLVSLLMWKGAQRLFRNNGLNILRSIDLSSNQLTGDIPEDIGNLIALVSLNLSRNNLTGEITSKIRRLTSLDSLDLSRNHFFGPIPNSLVQIDRLSMLDLSNNNLSGKIPIGTQLQSFDVSSYEGNADLCGKPLDKKCPGDEEVTHQKPEKHEESSQEDKKPIYLSVATGFITGFSGLWGSLFLSRNWRHAYVMFLNKISDTLYVFMVLNAKKCQRWLRGLLLIFSFPSFTLAFIYFSYNFVYLNHEIANI